MLRVFVIKHNQINTASASHGKLYPTLQVSLIEVHCRRSEREFDGESMESRLDGRIGPSMEAGDKEQYYLFKLANEVMKMARKEYLSFRVTRYLEHYRGNSKDVWLKVSSWWFKIFILVPMKLIIPFLNHNR